MATAPATAPLVKRTRLSSPSLTPSRRPAHPVPLAACRLATKARKVKAMDSYLTDGMYNGEPTKLTQREGGEEGHAAALQVEKEDYKRHVAAGCGLSSVKQSHTV